MFEGRETSEFMHWTVRLLNPDILEIFQFKIFRIIEDFKPIMPTGVPELNLPPMDPLSVDLIDFKFFDATVEFRNSILVGFQKMNVKYSRVDPVER